MSILEQRKKKQKTFADAVQRRAWRSDKDKYPYRATHPSMAPVRVWSAVDPKKPLYVKEY
jgi:hypothetical protein